MKKKKAYATFLVRIYKEQDDQLRRISYKEKRSKAAVIREFLEVFLADYKK